MHLTSLTRSTHARFAGLVAAVFVAAYVIAGWFAFTAINADLDARVVQSVELATERLEDVLADAGEPALVDAINSRIAVADPDDQVYWIGRRGGSKIAGRDVPSPFSLETGTVMGAKVAADPEDRYHLAIRDTGDLRILVAYSYEESEEIVDAIRNAFLIATGASLLFAGLGGVILARRGQARLDQIASTLRKVANGEMQARVPLRGSQDDLGALSVGINAALQQLEATVEGIRQVSANIAHDLRTPINRLSIKLEMLKDAVPDGSDLQPLIDDANEEVRHITSTFGALLRISQIEAGARKAKFETVSLNDIASNVFDAYRPVADDNSQALEITKIGSEDVQVTGDEALLTQLLANLIENAIHHCPAGAQIRIETGNGLQGSWLSVSDTGPGIPEAERSRVLKRFYRLEKSRTTPGSGLGLAMVKAISDLHGANLKLSDNRPGLLIRLDFPHVGKALRK